MVATSAHAQPKKEKIAILGLEIGGNLDAESTKVANTLTTQLRILPKAGKGPYQLALNSEKESIDERLGAGCEQDEKENKCMAGIGKSMGADYLMWGKIERRSQGKEAGYQVKLTLLNVKTPNNPQHHLDFIPLAESLDARVGNWARKFYKALTKFNDGGTLVVTANTDRGTILIENAERGNITNSKGEVPDLPAGRYRVAVVSEGFQRWESADKVTIVNGEINTLDVTLVRKPCDPTTSVSCETAIADPPKSVAKKVWVGVMVAGLLTVAGGTGYVIKLEGDKSDLSNSDCFNADNDPSTEDLCGPEGSNAMTAMTPRSTIQADGEALADKQTKVWVVVGIGGAVAVAGFVGAFVLSGSGKEKQAAGNTTVRRNRRRIDNVVVAPVIGPESAGATLRFNW